MPRLACPLVILVILALSTQVSLAGVAKSDPASSFSTITVNNTADVIADDGSCTLREAITAANSDLPSGTTSGECVAGNGADIVIIPIGTYTLTRSGMRENQNQTGDLDITSDVSLLGAGKDGTIIDADGIDRVIHLVEGVTTIASLSITGGIAPQGVSGAITGEHGGGIYIATGATPTTLLNVRIIENSAGRGKDGEIAGTPSTVHGSRGGDGGEIVHVGGHLTIMDSEIRHNSAGRGGDGGSGGDPKFPGGMGGNGGKGGGIASLGMLTITNTTIDTNHGGQTGIPTGVMAFGNGGHGGGIYSNGMLTMRGSTISRNDAGDGAAANERSSNGGNAGGLWLAEGTIENSTISTNQSGYGVQESYGSGIFVQEEVTIMAVTIAFNDQTISLGSGMALADAGAVMMANSVLADNDCYEGTVQSQGYNHLGL